MSNVAQATRELARRRAQVVGISERLVVQAEEALRRRLAKDGDDASLWRRLADTQRMLGRFAEARDCYRRSLALAADPAASWVYSVLGSGKLPPPPTSERAVPFVQLTGFLTPEEQQRLWSTTLGGRYKPAEIGKGTLDSSRRAAAIAKKPTCRAVRRWFGPKLRTALPAVLARLGADNRGLLAEDVGEFNIEYNLTAHHAGGYYTCHTDTGTGRLSSRRRLSYVYYFHRQPRRFTGGDLLLYDTNYDTGKTSTRAYTRLRATDNAIVLFPSNSYHEITKVVPASGVALAFAEGRFTVNGWVHEAGPPPKPA